MNKKESNFLKKEFLERDFTEPLPFLFQGIQIKVNFNFDLMNIMLYSQPEK